MTCPNGYSRLPCKKIIFGICSMHITTAKHGFTRQVLTMAPALSSVHIACVSLQIPNTILLFASGRCKSDRWCLHLSHPCMYAVSRTCLKSKSAAVVVFQAVLPFFPSPSFFRIMALQILMTIFDNIHWWHLLCLVGLGCWLPPHTNNGWQCRRDNWRTCVCDQSLLFQAWSKKNRCCWWNAGGYYVIWHLSDSL